MKSFFFSCLFVSSSFWPAMYNIIYTKCYYTVFGCAILCNILAMWWVESCWVEVDWRWYSCRTELIGVDTILPWHHSKHGHPSAHSFEGQKRWTQSKLDPLIGATAQTSRPCLYAWNWIHRISMAKCTLERIIKEVTGKWYKMDPS